MWQATHISENVMPCTRNTTFFTKIKKTQHFSLVCGIPFGAYCALSNVTEWLKPSFETSVGRLRSQHPVLFYEARLRSAFDQHRVGQRPLVERKPPVTTITPDLIQRGGTQSAQTCPRPAGCGCGWLWLWLWLAIELCPSGQANATIPQMLWN